MIVAEPVQLESDAASTSTLVTAEAQRIPRHFIKLIYASCIVSLACFIMALLDDTMDNPVLAVATILAFVFILPYHGAALLLQWLHRHQTDSIFPFSPSSPRALAYKIFLGLLWSASTAMCAIRLNSHYKEWYLEVCYDWITHAAASCGPSRMPLKYYWPSIPPIVLSAVELLLITAMALVCWAHRRPKSVPASATPSNDTLSRSKIISA